MERKIIDARRLLDDINRELTAASNRTAWLAAHFESGSDKHERCYRLSNDIGKLAKRIQRELQPAREVKG